MPKNKQAHAVGSKDDGDETQDSSVRFLYEAMFSEEKKRLACGRLG